LIENFGSSYFIANNSRSRLFIVHLFYFRFKFIHFNNWNWSCTCMLILILRSLKLFFQLLLICNNFPILFLIIGIIFSILLINWCLFNFFDLWYRISINNGILLLNLWIKWFQTFIRWIICWWNWLRSWKFTIIF
jgi:hypothetical protein